MFAIGQMEVIVFLTLCLFSSISFLVALAILALLVERPDQ